MPLPYQVYEYGQPRTDKEVNREHYDGVTCDNHHMTLRLERDKADITFKYDYQDDTVPKREQSSIQFWFKLGDSSYYYPANSRTYTEVPIFEMTDRVSKQVYWSVFLMDSFTNVDGERKNVRELVISPYGRSRTGDMQDFSVIFDNLSYENEDDEGWWHLSCSMWALNNVDCILHNKKGSTFKRTSLEQMYLLIPYSEYKATFSNSIDHLFIKHFRFFTKYLTHGEVDDTRYNTLPPNYDSLSFSSSFLENTQFLVPDYQTSTKTVYDPDTRELVDELQYYYHAICPPFTYYKNGYCYKMPVNSIEVNVFPFIDEFNENDLSWLLTVQNSNFISRDVQSKVDVHFFTNDETLD